MVPAPVNGLVFHKMSGSGNDFVLLDGRHTPPEGWTPERIRAVCDRRTGVGADGMVILTPTADQGIRLDYWNRDGSVGALCGNASLCATRLAVHLELAPATAVTLLTGAGPVEGRAIGGGHTAEIRVPSFALPKPVDLPLEPGELAMAFTVVGVPHLVVQVGDAATVDVARRGAELRAHPEFGAPGANVNFVSPPAAGDSAWLIRTFERGVEAETLACGTGTVAAAFALVADGRVTLPGEFVTQLGQRLAVSGRVAAGEATDVWLLGEGRLVYTGILGG